MNDTVDLLQIRIENAKKNLPEETLNAIAAVDWRAVILGMRTSKGYDFEQLGDLELETELLLCGLTDPADYPKELEKRMRISRAQANELVSVMNNLVFKKIKEELIKNTERKKVFANKNKIETEIPKTATKESVQINNTDTSVLKSAGIEVVPEPIPARNAFSIPASNASRSDAGWADAGGENREEILKKVENPEEKVVHSILKQKISGSFQMPTVKTEHSPENISKDPDTSVKPALTPPDTGGGESSKADYKVDPYRMMPE